MLKMRINKFVLFLIPIVLSSCLPGKKTSSTSTSSSNNGTQTNTSDTSITDTSEDEDFVDEDLSKFESITLDKRELELKVNKIYNLAVNFNPKEGQTITEEDRQVTWSTSSDSIAQVSQYGVVTAKSAGQALITCTTIDEYKRATCTVYVYNSEADYTKEWQKVTSTSQLTPGDFLVITCPQKGKTATSEHTGMYLHPTDSAFSSSGDKITNLGSLTEIFVYDGTPNNCTFENEEGQYLATTHTGKVTFINKTGNINWDIDYDNEWHVCDMQSTSAIDGWFMYNSSQQKFTTYESNEQVDMFVITLYKQVRILNS